jgi:hypothetical protein
MSVRFLYCQGIKQLQGQKMGYQTIAQEYMQ